MGESSNPDGMIVLVKYDGETPYLYFFKDGLIEEKVVSYPKMHYCGVNCYSSSCSDLSIPLQIFKSIELLFLS